MTPEISVIICTHNRYQTLNDAIASIEIQDAPPARFELLIVDNSSDLAARKLFMEALDIACQHRVIVEPVPGLSRARNIGVRAAKGEIVAFMDDDARAGANWVSQLLETFQSHPKAGVVGGPVRPIWPAARPPWLHPWLEGYFTIVDRGPKLRELTEGEWLAGTNIAFRRQALIEAGLFNENLGRVGKLLLSNEELAVSAKLRETGFTVIYDPMAAMFHRVHPERIDQAWMRRRVFWQVVSDMFSYGAEPGDFDTRVSGIFDYLMKLPPKERGLAGFFLNTDDPELFHEQLAALSGLIRLIATDGRDLREFLEPKLP